MTDGESFFYSLILLILNKKKRIFKGFVMSRSAYLSQQKQRGRHLFGVFPALYPKEIFWAMNTLPVEIWDPPLETGDADAHLQPYICSVVRSGLELILSGQTTMVDGFLFPHTCDSIQNLASIVNDYLGLETPCYFWYNPKAPYGAGSRRYYADQLKLLIRQLEELLGPMEPDALRFRVAQGRHLRVLLKALYDLRSRGGLAASNTAFYSRIREGEYLHPDDFIPSLEAFLTGSKGPGSEGPGVILSGILPNREILEHLDQFGVPVVADDLLNCHRRMAIGNTVVEDPYEALVDNYFAMPPCPTRGSPIQARIDFLLEQANQSGAKGVIFCGVKFCEPELFDLPEVISAIKGAGLHTLVLDVAVHQPLSGQLITRVEAFSEMIR